MTMKQRSENEEALYFISFDNLKDVNLEMLQKMIL